MDFIFNNLPELLVKTWQQIYLAGLALIVAIIIGIPLGIWIARYPRLRHVILSIANILQTIPSLALLALLLPFLGIGIKPALLALSIYALLPIIRNTATGIANVSPTMIEAADGLGFTHWQKMWMVELPLALPVIIAGIRIATAMSIGIATLAAFIGAGGLGDFIYQGLSLNNVKLILLGAVPAAILALVFDMIIARIENYVVNRNYKKITFFLRKRLLYILISAFLIMVIAAASVTFFLLARSQQKVIRIGSKDFTEQFILGEIMAQMIEAKTDLTVDGKFNLGGTVFCHEALINGDIDLYPEYTGTAYLVILKQIHPESINQVYQQVKQAYQKRFNLIWLAPFGFNNTNTLAVRQDFAKQYHLNTISDLLPFASQLTIGVPSDFFKRPDGFIGLEKTYHLKFKKVALMDPGLLYHAIKNKDVDVIMAFSTDGRIPAYRLTLLTDDKKLFPPYYAAPVIRQQTLQAHPEIVKALAPLANLIDANTMQKLNYEVDVEKKSPAEVAREFLRSENLLN